MGKLGMDVCCLLSGRFIINFTAAALSAAAVSAEAVSAEAVSTQAVSAEAVLSGRVC